MPARRHGLATSEIYRVWAQIVNRCRNPTVKSYKYYGARGIGICDRWLTFDNFFEDVGHAPPGTSLERINNDGNYEPSNVRWATRHDQARNKTNNRWIEFRGQKKVLKDWADGLGITPGALISRLDYKGWSIEKALTTPKPERPNSKLNMRQARAIRSTYPKLSADKIAAKYGVSKKTVLNIIHGKIFIE